MECTYRRRALDGQGDELLTAIHVAKEVSQQEPPPSNQLFLLAAVVGYDILSHLLLGQCFQQDISTGITEEAKLA